MRLPTVAPIAGLVAILLANIVPASRAQDPGETAPSLEALVGNSTAIMVVRVKSLRTDDAKRTIEQLRLDVVEYLKRPAEMPKVDGGTGAEKPAIEIAGDSAKRLRFYLQSYWGLDLSSPIETFGFLPEAFEKQTDVLLFQGFQSPRSGELQILAPAAGPVFLTDWTVLSSADAIRKTTRELVQRYRGVAQLRLALLDVNYFTTPLEQAGLVEEDSAPPVRTLIVPTDSLYEKMLVAQLKNPELLHEDDFTFDRVRWEDNTRLLYRFDTPENRALLNELLKDPEIGQVQKKLLTEILAAWD